jgi:hypothetical protein
VLASRTVTWTPDVTTTPRELEREIDYYLTGQLDNPYRTRLRPLTATWQPSVTSHRYESLSWILVENVGTFLSVTEPNVSPVGASGIVADGRTEWVRSSIESFGCQRLRGDLAHG